VVVTIALLFFLAISALACGVALTFSVGDEGAAPPVDWLDAIPLVDSWVVPGLILGIGFGLGSLLVGYGVLTRPRWEWARFIEKPTGHHWTWLGTILIGIGHVVWLGPGLVSLPELSVLQVVYGATGLALLALPFVPTVSSHLRRR